jgi:CRP/FNR family cyclic AMP-dependent transcriptional regulator
MVNFIWENLFRPEEKEKSLRALLNENYLFQDLGSKDLRFVMDIVHVRNYHATEIIFRQGEVGVGMYIVMKGSVDIIIDENAHGEINESYITQLNAGDFFGELALLEDNGKRTATARAREESVLVGFFKPDLMEVMERNPPLGVKLTFRLGEILGRRLKETTNKVTQLKNELRKYENPLENRSGTNFNNDPYTP